MKKGFFFILTLITVFIALTFSPKMKAATSANVVKDKPIICTNPCTQSDIGITANKNHIYTLKGDLNITGKIPGDSSNKNTAVVFVKGNLAIGPMGGNNTKLDHNDQNSGLVFVVSGNVNIDQSITRIDAVIISEGIICTAHDGTSCMNGNTVTPQLVLNGSLISLNPDKPIQFKRNLNDNSQPAEVINHQVKYLVILRDLLSDTYQKWSEIP